MRWLALLIPCVATAALADEVPKIEVAIGEQASRDVAIANGYLCDDPTLISVEMRQRTQTSNEFVVTGLKAGKTLCRVGTSTDRVHFVFVVEVTAKKAKPAPAKPKPAEPDPPASPPIQIDP